MGDNRLFWPQELMDEWIVDEKAVIDGDVLVINDEPIRYRLSQAVHFVGDVGDGDDQHKLVGKVKEVETIVAAGWEHYMDSVIVEDSAYQVVQGFTGVPLIEETVTAAGQGSENIAVAIKQQSGDESNDDRELLANFLLNNL